MSGDRDYYYEQVFSAFVKKDQVSSDLDKVIRKHKDRLEQLTKKELARRKRERECPRGCVWRLGGMCDCNSRESVNSPVEPMSLENHRVDLETFRKDYFKDIQDMKDFRNERLYWLSKENISDLEKDELEYSLGNKKSAITTSIYIMTQIITDRVMKEMMGSSY
jgi:hypothetical protein